MITDKAKRIISTAGFYSEINKTSIIVEIRKLLEEQPLLDITPNKRATLLIDGLVKKYGYVTTDILITLYGGNIYMDLYELYMYTYTYNKQKIIRDEALDIANIMRRKQVTIIITGEDGSGRSSMVDGILHCIDKEKDHPLNAHECIKVDEYMLAMGVNFIQKGAEIIGSLMGPASIYNPILYMNNGDVIADVLSAGDKFSILNTGIGLVFSILSKISCPKIIICRKGKETLLASNIEGYVHIVDATKFNSEEQRKNIIKDILDEFETLNPDLSFEYNACNKDYTKKGFINKLAEIESPISELYNTIDNSLSYIEDNVSKIIIQGPLSEDIAVKIKKLPTYLNTYIIGQDDNKDKICLSLKKNLILRDEKPLSCILLAGPTGVGKTETARRIAEHMFGDHKTSMLRLDMGEFEENHTISALLGSPAGYVGFGGTTRLGEFLERRRSKGGLILFDELDKAARSVQDILLGMMDYGSISMRTGIRYALQDYIIMATTNANTERKTMQMGAQRISQDSQKLTETFRKELIGRFDIVSVYNELNLKELQTIAQHKLNELSDILSSKKSRVQIEIEWAKTIGKQIVELIPVKNGREVDYYIQNNVRSTIADFLCDHPKTQKITLNIDNKNISITPYKNKSIKRKTKTKVNKGK